MGDSGAAKPGSRQALLVTAAKAYSYVALWIVLSGGVIMFNKYLLAYGGFPYPITLTMWHMLFCSALAAVVVQTGLVKAAENMTQQAYVGAVVPIGCTFAAVLWLSNTSYLTLSVSFIQMLKALMPVTVFCVGIAFGTETYKLSTLVNMVAVTVGVALATYGEINFVWSGFLCQMASMALEAVRLTLVQLLMQRKGNLKLNPVTTMYYVSPCCFVFLTIPWALLEAPQLLAAVNEGTAVISAWVMIGNAMSAFLLNMAIYLVVGETSALTMNIAGVVKDWMLIGVSSYIFMTPVSALGVGGYSAALMAVFYYNWTKIQAAMAKQAEAERMPAAANEEQETLLQKEGFAQQSQTQQQQQQARS